MSKEKQKPSVEIVIPNYDKPDLLANCLKTLTTWEDYPCKIMVVDDGSNPVTKKKIKEFREACDFDVYFKAENEGFASACNVRFRNFESDWILFLNNDITVEKNFVKPMLDTAENLEADVVGAKLLYPNGTIQHAGVFYSYENEGWFNHWFRGEDQDIKEANKDYLCLGVTGACMMISKKARQKIGIFDEEFGHGHEDVDYCLRAWFHNLRVAYCSDTKLVHPEGSTLPERVAKELKEKSIKKLWERWHKLDVYNLQDKVGQAGGIVNLKSKMNYTQMKFK